MKLFNKILLLLMLLSGLQILTEELISNHEAISMEVNMEFQKEEKENKDELFELNQSFYFPMKQLKAYKRYTTIIYQNPIIIVRTTPPESFT